MSALFFEAPVEGGPLPPSRGQSDERGGREPLVNAPWPVVALTLSIVAGYAIQSRFPLEFVAEAFAFSPDLLFAGGWGRMFTSLFLHGAWSHALMNAAFILAFGAPVARFFGPRFWGVFLFFAFYLTCGVLACVGFAALHWGEPAALLGASGAASGLMGAAARLIGGRGEVGPVFSQAVTGMGLAWLIVNIVMALFGNILTPGAPGGAVGWEAHLAGFAAGVLIIGPFGWIARHL
jgi:membrane associated rhomboid family serine protease